MFDDSSKHWRGYLNEPLKFIAAMTCEYILNIMDICKGSIKYLSSFMTQTFLNNDDPFYQSLQKFEE